MSPTETAQGPPTQVPPTGSWMGHPRGLSTLFFTELWERFSYYGMRGILVLFLTDAVRGGFGMGTETAGAIYGLYTAAVYMVCLPGGWIADRLIGQRNSIFIGGIVIALGHFSLAMVGITHAAFYIGLMLIIIGTGLLKPNISAIVGGLYPEGGARRDAGFSIYYMGINIGAFAGPIVCGQLGENVDWHYGFAAAGVGMVLGLIQYKLGYKHLGNIGVRPEREHTELKRDWGALYKGLGIIAGIGVVLTIVRVTGLWAFTLSQFALALGYGVTALVVVYFLFVLSFGKLERVEKGRVIVIFFLFIGAALFWSGFEQAGSSMNLFAERMTNRVMFGWEAPASWLQSVNPLFIIMFAPVFGMLWARLGSRAPSIPVKFFYGLFQLGISFAIMAWAATYTTDGGIVSPMWLVVTYFFQTTGELCLSPVGLSSVTKLSPHRYVGQMMGIWFMGSALGNLIAGLVGGQFEAMPLPNLFVSVALIAAGSGVLFLAFSKPIRKMIGGIV
jgi:POT family proton-dependent oligopeptide transporter